MTSFTLVLLLIFAIGQSEQAQDKSNDRILVTLPDGRDTISAVDGGSRIWNEQEQEKQIEEEEDAIVCCICYEPLDDDPGIEYGSEISRSVSPVFDFHGSNEKETRDLERGEQRMNNRFAQHKSHSCCAKGYVRYHQKAVSASSDLDIIFDDVQVLASRISCPICRKAVDFEYAQGKGLVKMSTLSTIGSRVKVALLVFLLLVSYILVYQISHNHHDSMTAATVEQEKSAEIMMAY